MTIRDDLSTALKAVLPSAWKIIPYQRNLDALDSLTVILKQSTIQDAPDAPQGKYQVSYTVTIASPKQSVQNAEDDLDDAVFVLLDAIKGIPWVKCTKAQKVVVDDQYLGYDLDCTLQTKK